MRTAIVLFTRDLRMHDNLALSTAAREAKQIVPLFVFDNAILGSAFARPNRVSFLLDALRDLDASLRSRGARLVLRSGDVVAETLSLAREVGAEAVFVAEDASAYAQRRLARLFSVIPERAWVDLGEEELEARYGPCRLRTSPSNIARVEVTGPYCFLKTAGPARLGITDGGLTFASNGERGGCITFRSPVPGIDPFGRIRHPELTVTVVDVDGLMKALAPRRPSSQKDA